MSFSQYVTAQHIQFPLDTNTVSIDGVIQSSEWSNAATVMIGINTVDNVQVMYKHDNNAMYFAFTGKLESANALFPELLIDPLNIEGTAWVNGQWWFHVSATDCENNGAYGVYNNCMTIQSGWEGAPNFTAGAPVTDTVEIRIPFSKVGFNTATMDTMGIAMMVSNTANIFRLYPTGANKDIPASWAKATFSKTQVGITKVGTVGDIIVYPNPANNMLFIKGVTTGSWLHVKDMSGRLLHSRIVNSNAEKISLAQYVSGLYCIEIILATGEKYTYKWSKQ